MHGRLFFRRQFFLPLIGQKADIDIIGEGVAKESVGLPILHLMSAIKVCFLFDFNFEWNCIFFSGEI